MILGGADVSFFCVLLLGTTRFRAGLSCSCSFSFEFFFEFLFEFSFLFWRGEMEEGRKGGREEGR